MKSKLFQNAKAGQSICFGFGRGKNGRGADVYFAYIPLFITPWKTLALNELYPGYLYGHKILAIRPSIYIGQAARKWECPLIKIAIGKQLQLEEKY